MKKHVVGLFFITLPLVTLPYFTFSQTNSEEQRFLLKANLYQFRHQEIAEGKNFEQLKKELLEGLKKQSPQASSTKAAGVSYDQARLILSKLLQERIYYDYRSYDPQGNIGFCFGRAMYLHLQLLRHGVAKDSIKKIFAIGPMRTGEINWQFHVATMVKDKNSNDWWVLDSNLPRPLSIEKWIEYYQKFRIDQTSMFFGFFKKTDNEKSIRFYVTEASKFGSSAWQYSPQSLNDPFYNNFFKDMLRDFKENPVPLAEKFSPTQCRQLF